MLEYSLKNMLDSVLCQERLKIIKNKHLFCESFHCITFLDKEIESLTQNQISNPRIFVT